MVAVAIVVAIAAAVAVVVVLAAVVVAAAVAVAVGRGGAREGGVERRLALTAERTLREAAVPEKQSLVETRVSLSRTRHGTRHGTVLT